MLVSLTDTNDGVLVLPSVLLLQVCRTSSPLETPPTESRCSVICETKNTRLGTKLMLEKLVVYPTKDTLHYYNMSEGGSPSILGDRVPSLGLSCLGG
jgi:hypothetical protein